MNLRATVLAAVLELGECSVGQVVSKVGPSISAAQAASSGRRDRRSMANRKRGSGVPKVKLADRGISRLVVESLARLAGLGRIRRVSRGVYAPPLPKIFRAS